MRKRSLPRAAVRRGAAGSSLHGFFESDAATRNLSLAVTASIVIHAIVLSIQFRLPEIMLNKVRDSQLEVVLVNSKSVEKPKDAQAKAQANLDGGGNVAEDRRAKTPLPPSPSKRSGDELVEAQRRVQELEARQQALLTQARSEQAIATDARVAEAQTEPVPLTNGIELAQRALAMARMEAQIAQRIEEYNKWPRKKFIGTRTTEAVEAQYVEDWRQKVERVGNLNYPEAAKGKMYGNLLMTVEINADGSLNGVEISRSSGHRLLDDTARRIVQMAAPYGPFPAALKRSVDILVITRTWSFTSRDQLHAD
jgi:protein TonB